ncbi:50S ribosomal protein L16 [Patescibacteria group bacterium]|nr:50S ribosomal protein L16 [Patescibacteria group bacterium]
MMEPKRLKYRRHFRGRRKGLAQRGQFIDFGDIGLKALGRGWLKSNQIEAARKAIRNYTKRSGKLWIRVFPNKPVTKKPPEVRMGAGKGPLSHYVAVIRPGAILFELAGIEKETAKEALRLAQHKLPIRTKVVTKDGELRV